MPVKQEEKCVVCVALDVEAGAAPLSRVVVEGRILRLCRSHAATVASEMPQTFDDLRKLFVGFGAETARIERRSPISRRDFEDRRVFPPRPEGRRLASGRRDDDLVDA